jgi:cytosine/adenosine deaminase-related metal-dependent hydrolase
VSELLIAGGTLVAMDRERRVGALDLLIRGRDIAWLGPPGKAPPKRRGEPRERLDARGCVVTPGFVQAHVHLCQVLFRGLADDLPLLRWLRERIWPLESSHDEASLKASAELGLCELLCSGTTTILDMGTVQHHDVVFDAMARFGIRGASGKAMMDVAAGAPRGLRESTRHSLHESDRLRDTWHGRDAGRLRYAYAPRFVLSCTERLLREVAGRGGADGVLIHTHVAEHEAEREEARRVLGQDDLAFLEACGLRGPHVVMAHGVQLGAREMRRAARLGTRFVHCPSANLKLASGIADVPGMRARGLVVGLGADGAPCNNRLDALSEARLAALLAKVRREDAAALSAYDALAMLTIEGARCLGLAQETGSLEVGKRADVTVTRIDGPHHAPACDPVSSLIYAASGRDVWHVVVDGVVRVRDALLCDQDHERIAATARAQAKKLLSRARIRGLNAAACS